MKKFLAVLIILFLVTEFFGIWKVKAISTDVPPPDNYYAYSSGATINIKWHYTCPSGFSCYVEIYEYKTGIWDNIATIPASYSYSILGQSYGRHQYKLRAKLISILITMYSNYTSIFEAYVLNKPTGLIVSVNPDLLFAEGDSYLTLKWNTVDSNATYVRIWRRIQGIDIYDVRATLVSSATTFNDTTVLPNTTYEYVIHVIRKDDTSIHDDDSLSSTMVSKLTLPAPPTNFQANAIDKTAYMAWQHTKNCDGYKIYKWVKSGMLFYWSLVATIDKNTLSYHTTVTDYGAYSFKVTAYNASGDSPKSPTQNAYALTKPTGLTATALSTTSIKLTWNLADTNATTIAVSYSTNGMIYLGIGSFSSSSTSATITSLNPDTQYWFKIVARRDSNESLYSDPVIIKTLKPGTPPNNPTGFGGVALSCSKVDLTWEDQSNNEDGFKIERKEDGGMYAEIGTAPANNTSYSDTTILPEKTYYYRVRTYNSYGNSGYSIEINITIPECVSDIYSTGMITVGGTMTCDLDLGKQTGSLDPPIDFFWEQVTSVERYITPKNNATFHVIGIVDFDSLTLSGLKTYSYSSNKINGSNDASNQIPTGTVIASLTNEGRYSKVKIEVYGYSLVIKFVTYKSNPPNSPQNLTASSISSSEINLTWSDNSDNEGGFKIERKEIAGTYAETKTLSANTTSYSDTGLNPNTTYYYRVRAYNGFGNSDYSNEANATTKPAGTSPSAPTNLAANAVSKSEINLTWSDNSDNEGGFKIERKEPGGTYALISTTPANSTSYDDQGLTANTIYYYRISTYNSYGNSPYSNEANATTKKELTIPNKPIDITATAISTNEIKITWTDNSDNEDGFKIERALSGGSYTEINTLPPNTSVFLDSGLNPDTRYYYRVRAFNAAGNSEYSSERNATTFKQVEQIIIRLYIDKTTYYVNDELKTMDVAPIIKESRTLLPIRYVAEALGADVQWDATERKVTITFKGTTIELWIDKNSAKVNGEYKLIDQTNPKVVPVIIPPGRTMLPIRFIAENLGCTVDWDATLREVKITYPAS